MGLRLQDAVAQQRRDCFLVVIPQRGEDLLDVCVQLLLEEQRGVLGLHLPQHRRDIIYSTVGGNRTIAATALLTCAHDIYPAMHSSPNCSLPLRALVAQLPSSCFACVLCRTTGVTLRIYSAGVQGSISSPSTAALHQTHYV